MFGTRKLEKFDLHGLRRAAAVDARDEPSESVGFESGERPTLPFDALAEVGGDLIRSDFAPEAPGSSIEPPAVSATRAIHQAPTPFVAWVPMDVPAIEAPASTPSAPASTPSAPASTPSAPPPTADALRTQLTRKFVGLAETVRESLRDVTLGGATYAVELTAPTGMSTAGGKQALQHLRLVSRGDGGAALLAGTVNQVEQNAELRDYDHIATLHGVRFGRALDFDRAAWDVFLVQAEAVLSGAGVRSLRTPPPRDLLEERRRMQQRVSKPATYALVIALALAAIAVSRVVMILLRR